MLKDLRKTVAKKHKLPPYVIADSGYGSEENYEYLEMEEMMGYVKSCVQYKNEYFVLSLVYTYILYFYDT